MLSCRRDSITSLREPWRRIPSNVINAAWKWCWTSKNCSKDESRGARPSCQVRRRAQLQAKSQGKKADRQLSANWGLPLNPGPMRALCPWGREQRKTCCRRCGGGLFPVPCFWPGFSSWESGRFRLAPAPCDRKLPSHFHLPGRPRRSKRPHRRRRQPRRSLRLPQRRRRQCQTRQSLQLSQRQRQLWKSSRSQFHQAEPIRPQRKSPAPVHQQFLHQQFCHQQFLQQLLQPRWRSKWSTNSRRPICRSGWMAA